MRSRASRVAAALVLLTCVVCPILELFDRWDHTVQTGQDTEYALVVVALCIGAAYAFARFVLRVSLIKFAAALVTNFVRSRSLLYGEGGSVIVVPVAASPPPLALRI